MKIASKMIIGSGMPISHSNNPRPNPMTILLGVQVPVINADCPGKFRHASLPGSQ
jgi:hypothetical protein